MFSGWNAEEISAAPSAEPAARRAARHLLQANRLESRGAPEQSARAVRDAARVLFAASARTALAGVCRRILLFESLDPQVDCELGHLAAMLNLEEESRALRGRLQAEHRGTSDADAQFRARANRDEPNGPQRTGDPLALTDAAPVEEGEPLPGCRRARDAARRMAMAARAGAGPETHRQWACATLAGGDLAGAWEHVEHWSSARPDDLVAMLWRAQLLWRNGRGLEATQAWERVRARLPRGRASVAADALIGADLALAWGLAGPPLWWLHPEEIRGVEEEAGKHVVRRPLLVLDRDDHFHRLPLSDVLREGGFEVVDASGEHDLTSVADRLGRLPAAFVVHFDEPANEGIDLLRGLSARPGLASVAMVAVTTLGRRGLDLGTLRDLGVVGVIDKRMIPEDVVDRLQRVLLRSAGGRRFVRVPAYLPVDLESDGVTTTEYTRNLSVGGIGLLSSRRIPANTDVHLRFRLELSGVDVEVSGRVINERDVHGAADNELGIFFYPMETGVRGAIELEVERRATWRPHLRLDGNTPEVSGTLPGAAATEDAAE